MVAVRKFSNNNPHIPFGYVVITEEYVRIDNVLYNSFKVQDTGVASTQTDYAIDVFWGNCRIDAYTGPGATLLGCNTSDTAYVNALAEGRIFAAGVTVLRAYTDKGSAYSTVWSKKIGDSGELIQPDYRNGIVYSGIGNTLYALQTMKLTINRLNAIINQRIVTMDIGPRKKYLTLDLIIMHLMNYRGKGISN